MKIIYEMSQKYKGLQLHDPENREENSFYSEHAIFIKNPGCNWTWSYILSITKCPKESVT